MCTAFLQSAPSFSLRFPGQPWKCKHKLLRNEWTRIDRIEKPTVRKPVTRPSADRVQVGGAGRARRQPFPLLYSLSCFSDISSSQLVECTDVSVDKEGWPYKDLAGQRPLLQDLHRSPPARLCCLLGFHALPLLGS